MNNLHTNTLFSRMALFKNAALVVAIFAGAGLVNAKDAPKKDTKKAHKAGHEAHVHGAAKLSIALDSSKSGTILLESPGESIVGFEHEAKSPADKKTQEAALATLDKKASELFAFDKALACVVAKIKIEIKKDDDHEGDKKEEDHHDHHAEKGEHTEVEAEYSLKCQKDLTGSTLKITLGKSFPKIKDLDVQVLGEKSQTSHELENGVGSLKL